MIKRRMSFRNLDAEEILLTWYKRTVISSSFSYECIKIFMFGTVGQRTIEQTTHRRTLYEDGIETEDIIAIKY